MGVYLRNKHGRIVEVQEPDVIVRLKSEGAKVVSDQEANEYFKRKTEMANSSDDQTNTLYYQTVSGSPNGYGMSRDILKRELLEHDIVPLETYAGQKVGLLYNYPYGLPQMHTDVRIVMTMFESDKIPEDWPEYLAEADEVIVPSKFCADVFGNAGVETTVIPLGYNDRTFGFIGRDEPHKDGKPFTFIHYDSFNMRKGFQEVFTAFNEEFKQNEPVKLILKTVQEQPPVPIIPSQYPNIEVVTGELIESDLQKLLGRADCMVYPSRGEGFGITPLEAMATGLPAIVPNAHGISEYFNSQYMLEVKVSGKCPALIRKFKKENVGEMVMCDVKHLREQMRYAFNNQKEMRKLGKAASQYARNYTYRRTAEKLAEVIKKWRAKDVIKRKDTRFLRVEKA